MNKNLYFLDAFLWFVNAIVWSLYAHVPFMAITSLVAAIGAMIIAGRTEN